MAALAKRSWVPQASEALIQRVAGDVAGASSEALATRIEALAVKNRAIHERDCFNLNPATNIMNPRAEALLSSGIGSRPSLGYPGDKYEMGLEAIEEIEIIAAELAAEVFGASFAEIRVASGAMANLYAFMATCKPGDTIIAPPASIAGHVTHHDAGCAGLFGLRILDAPIDAGAYTVDLGALREMALRERPRLITLGGSLNLAPHPVAEIRAIADEAGAYLLMDAAHQCGMFAGKAWPNPLEQGAHLMTMSTYKSLGGPAGGLIVTRDADLAQRLDAIAFPGMTANFDAAKSAALAITLIDWRVHGTAYAQAMIDLARGLARALEARQVPIFGGADAVQGHQFAIEAARFGGGQTASRTLRRAGLLACGIGLPIDEVAGDLNGLRLGTPELARIGVGQGDLPALAELIARALTEQAPERLAAETAALRARFDKVHFIT